MTDTPMHMPEGYEETHHSRAGALLGIIAVILIAILSGFFLWGSMLHKEVAPLTPPLPNNEPETPRATADQAILETLSPSNELDAIEADLTSTNLDLIDTDITAIDAELGI